MKERSNIMSQNSNNLHSSTTNSSSTSLINSTIETNTSQDSSQHFSSPYNSNNFMAPPIGAIIRCVTCLENIVQGKVIAYDQQTKMLALRSAAFNKPGTYDYSMINVSWCSNLEIINEPNEPPEPLSNLNIQKLERRKKVNIDNKNKEINSLGTNVTPLAQHLYFTILKTLNEVSWDDKDIIVMNSVIIKPPYTDTCCELKDSKANNQALEHVKKIVKKFNEEYTTMSPTEAQENRS